MIFSISSGMRKQYNLFSLVMAKVRSLSPMDDTTIAICIKKSTRIHINAINRKTTNEECKKNHLVRLRISVVSVVRPVNRQNEIYLGSTRHVIFGCSHSGISRNDVVVEFNDFIATCLPRFVLIDDTK